MKLTNQKFWEGYFNKRFEFDPRRDLVWKEVCNFLQEKYIPTESKILDVGAAYCNFINNICGREKHAVDIFERFSDYANKDVITHINSCTNLSFFDDDIFDIVFASNLLEHLSREDLLDTISELNRILLPGGKLILLQPNFRYCYKEYFDDYTHLQVFTHESMSGILESFGFDVIDVKAKFLPVNMKSKLRFGIPKLHLFTRIYMRLPFKPFAGQMLIVAIKHRKEQ